MYQYGGVRVMLAFCHCEIQYLVCARAEEQDVRRISKRRWFVSSSFVYSYIFFIYIYILLPIRDQQRPTQDDESFL